MSVFDPRTFYAAIVTRIGGQTSKNVGLGVAPSDTTLPYAVVEPLDEDIDPERLGSLADAHVATFFVWQAKSVGSTVEQALWMQQKVRSALLAWTPVVTGFQFGKVELESVVPVLRDDDFQPPLFYAVDLFTVYTTV